MIFQEFLQYVPQILQTSLPGREAHYKMAPAERMSIFKNVPAKDTIHKNAGVLILLYPKNGITHLVLIVRNIYEGIHSAQISFPGGKFELADQNYANTALRETQEEIGVAMDCVEILKEFTQLYIQPSNFMVHPFLGICNEELLFIPDPSEVSEIIELPLSLFLDDKIMVSVTLSTSYADNIEVPAFAIDQHIVWGATAMMLSELKEVLKNVL